MTTLDAFTQGYIACMLWSTTDQSDEHGGEPLDLNYNTDDLAPEALEAIVKDCASFQETQAKDLSEYYHHFNASSAGHNFWLTRVGHGAGFWDRGLGELGERLTKASKAYGNIDPYVGDDNRIYLG
jgi:hypothetical protein